MLINVTFSALVLGAWTVLAVLVSDPIAWATWHSITGVRTWAEVTSYPYVMLWVVPLLGVAGSILARQLNLRTAAIGIALAPIAGFGLTFVWYYMAPATWL